MKKVSVRNLARCYLDTDHLSARRVEQTLEIARSRGWTWNFTPGPEDYDRLMVLIRNDHPMTPLLRATQIGEAVLPREFVERCAAGAMEVWDEVGCYLGRHGLALIAAVNGAVTLRGTTADLATIVNRTRYIAQMQISTRRAASAVLGRCYSFPRVHDAARLRAAIILEQFGVDAIELLDDRLHVRLKSAWMFPSLTNSQNAEREGA